MYLCEHNVFAGNPADEVRRLRCTKPLFLILPLCIRRKVEEAYSYGRPERRHLIHGKIDPQSESRGPANRQPLAKNLTGTAACLPDLTQPDLRQIFEV